MSDDIVYDLRHKQRLQEAWDMHKEPLWGRAADEIERLRARVAECEQFLQPSGWQKAQDYTNELSADNERLRGLLQKARSMIHDDPGDLADLTAVLEQGGATTDQPSASLRPYTVTVEPVIVSDAPDAQVVKLNVGVQHFRVGPDYWETRDEAYFFRWMLRQALSKTGAKEDEVTPSPTPACRYPACVDDGPGGKCTDWLVGDCKGPSDQQSASDQ